MINKEEEKIKANDSVKYDRFPKLPCRILRQNVFHGVKEENGTQTVVCLSCRDEYKFHIDGRNKIEISLWDLYSKLKDQVDLSPSLEKRPKQRWNQRYIIFRGE